MKLVKTYFNKINCNETLTEISVEWTFHETRLFTKLSYCEDTALDSYFCYLIVNYDIWKKTLFFP